MSFLEKLVEYSRILSRIFFVKNPTRYWTPPKKWSQNRNTKYKKCMVGLQKISFCTSGWLTFSSKKDRSSQKYKSCQKVTFCTSGWTDSFKWFGGPNYRGLEDFSHFMQRIPIVFSVILNKMKYDFWRSGGDPTRSIKNDFPAPFIFLVGSELRHSKKFEEIWRNFKKFQ